MKRAFRLPVRSHRDGGPRSQRRAGPALFVVALLALLVTIAPAAGNPALLGQLATPGATPVAEDMDSGFRAASDAVIFYSADGIRPDLVDQFIADGAMPRFATLIEDGVRGDNGMLHAFPMNTGANWHTMATGAYPGEHGALNNTFHRSGDLFENSSSGFQPGILQADTIGHVAERAGQSVVAVEWVGARGYDPPLQGPVIDYRSFFSDRGVLVNYNLENQPAGSERFGVTYQRVDLTDADGWTNVPESFSPARQQSLALTNTAFPAENNADRVFDLYIYDSTDDGAENYDRVLVAPASIGNDQLAARDGAQAVADLAVDEWAEVKVTLLGEREGQTAGFYLKPIEIAPDLSEFRLYYTSIQRTNATFFGCDYAPDCATPLGFEEDLASQFPTATAADFAPVEAGIVDEDTYVQQGLLWETAHSAYLTYIIEELGVSPDLLLLGTPVTDEFSHQFLGLITPTMQGQPNPYYDDLNADGEPDGRVQVRTDYLRTVYGMADQFLADAEALLGGEPTIFATSDHGFAPAYYAVNAGLVLQEAGLTETEQVANCRPAPTADAGSAETPVAEGEEALPVGPPVKVCSTGGTAMVYLNLDGRDPAGVVAAEDYDQVVADVIAAFENLSDPDNPDLQVVAAVYTRDEARDISGTDALHPTRTGDVIVVLQPPYKFDAAVPGELFAPSEFFGQHGYLPDLVDLEGSNVNMRAEFIAAGPGITSATDPITDVRAIDLAPTISFLLGMPGPRNARGQILYDILDGGENLRELTILNISDFHGQIPPLAATADRPSAEGAQSTSAPVGGVAYLKYWFDVYREDAPGTVLTIAGGDSIGATPPISAFFGDLPTIEFMNMLGFSADALGNHNFDVSAEYQTGTIAPLAEFPFLSVNVLDADGNTAGDDRSLIVEVDGAVFALVGFSNLDIPNLTRPGALGPYEVLDPIPLVTEEATRLRAEDGVQAVIAFGHYGATLGTIDEPDGPLIELADSVGAVDVVMGDHTDFTVNTVRPNGVLVTENLSKGAEFTRVRIVVDVTTGEVVHKTADQHRPWTAGVTPDPEIQARVTALNTELQPILAMTIATSSVAVPHADSCGTPNGRTCESLVGNVVTDAMRETYDVDFALSNSGGLRAALTCPEEDLGDDFCPADAPTHAITRGTVLGVLPFGNVVVTVEITGEELKAFLENGVARMPDVAGQFPQVSGLCFTYDIDQTAGDRVTSVVRQAADGSCSDEAVDLSANATYTLAINDFIAAGGDGYPDVAERVDTREPLDTVTGDYVAEQGSMEPSIQGRIVCEGSACPEQTG